jgi:cytochrome P450
VWRITQYEDALFLLKSDDVAAVELSGELQRLSDRLNGAFSNLILLLGPTHPFQNPPAHAPIRAWLRDFLNNTLRRWTGERMTELARSLLTSVDDEKSVDAVERLARPMPALIVSDMLGLDLPQVRLCGKLTRSLFSVWRRDTYALRDLRALEDAAAQVVTLLSAKFGDDRRDDYARLAALTMAGVETTTGLLGHAMNQLAAHPALQAQLREKPALVNDFINETLRIWPPLRRIVGRRTTKAIVLSDVTIPAGALIDIDLEGAHHDPKAYPEPQNFELSRKGPPSLAFGFGAHACVGAALGRLEAKVFIEQLLRDFAVHPAGEPTLGRHPDWCEFVSLPLQFERFRMPAHRERSA